MDADCGIELPGLSRRVRVCVATKLQSLSSTWIGASCSWLARGFLQPVAAMSVGSSGSVWARSMRRDAWWPTEAVADSK